MTYRDIGFNSFMQKVVLGLSSDAVQQVQNNISDLGLMSNPVTDMVFSSTDSDTAAWTAGTIYFSDGTQSGRIAAGNTGTMTGVTYIYFDRNKAGELHYTTSHSNAVGASKIIVAIADLGATGKDCKIIPAIGAGLSVSGITVNQINFTPVESDEVIASINASTEGITIEADNIAISGTTTFASGYNPTTKRTVFVAEPTTPYLVGDLWTDGTFLKRCNTELLTGAYNAAHWGLATGYTDDTVANSKIKTFAQDAIPTSVSAGDMWIDTNDGNKLYRAAIAGADAVIAGEWVLYQDSGIATAIQDAADAQSTADGKVITFAQDAIPTSTDVGDLWIDTNDGNKLYRAGAVGATTIAVGQWEVFRDTTIADAQATADGKIVSFYQTTVPTAEGAGDLWFDTDDNNKCYRATAAGDDAVIAGEWVAVPDNNKLNLLGGSYASAATGARVLVFPDINTGLQVIDDAAADVFKAVVGGTDVGDVVIGNYAGGQGIKYDKSAGTTTFAGSLSAAAGTLGAVTVGTNAWHIDSSGNMWWGNYATYADALIKVSAAGEITFTIGTFSGTLSAAAGTLGTITAGTITGITISTGVAGQTRVSMSSASDTIDWYDSGDGIGLTVNLVSTNIAQIESKDARALTLVSATGRVEFNDDIDLNTHDITGGGAIAGTFTGGLTGNVTGNCSGSSGSCTGNAASATFATVADYLNSTNDSGLNSYSLLGIGRLGFNTASNSTTSGRLWFYDAGGGTYYWRTRNGSWNGQFDQSAF